MKSIKYITILYAAVLVFASCEKRNPLPGLPEYDHHYYLGLLPTNNTGISVNKTQATLIKFPVQFHSAAVRSYDAIAKYAALPDSLAPAVAGVDFNIVDKNGVVIPSSDQTYSIVFKQAKYAADTIYVKLLNNPVSGTRKVEIRILENKTTDFYVDIFAGAYRRVIEIK